MLVVYLFGLVTPLPIVAASIIIARRERRRAEYWLNTVAWLRRPVTPEPAGAKPAPAPFIAFETK